MMCYNTRQQYTMIYYSTRKNYSMVLSYFRELLTLYRPTISERDGGLGLQQEPSTGHGKRKIYQLELWKMAATQTANLGAGRGSGITARTTHGKAKDRRDLSKMTTTQTPISERDGGSGIAASQNPAREPKTYGEGTEDGNKPEPQSRSETGSGSTGRMEGQKPTKLAVANSAFGRR